MAQQILDPSKHKRLKINTGHGETFGENTHFLPVIADELRFLCIEYPICFLKDSRTGKFVLNAILGFNKGENLYLDGDTWRAQYIPMHIQRQPFFIGGVKSDSDKRSVVTLDTDHPRVNENEGNSIFTDDGKPTEYLMRIQKLLSSLNLGTQKTGEFIEVLLTHGLIEQIRVTVKDADNKALGFDGIYSISETKLKTLSDDVILEFQSKEYLQAIHLLLVSMGHFQKLGRWHKEKV